jgi:hypothetical protein
MALVGRLCSGADAQVTGRGGGTFMKTRRMFLGGMLFAGTATGLAGSLTLSQPQELPRKQIWFYNLQSGEIIAKVRAKR